MSKLPKILPEYHITASSQAPFPVVFQELPGWFIKPIPGEHVSWGFYDMPKRNLTDTEHLKVTCPIEIHGITGVEIASCADEHYNVETSTHIQYAQLTDTHCRWLGDIYKDKDGVKHLRTFLDSDEYIDDWAFGEDNCGFPTHLSPTGCITRQGSIISTHQKDYLFDVVGRYLLEFNGKTYDTICIMLITRGGEMTEQYIDQNGTSILWRRFNHNHWQNSRYQKPWMELLPDSEKVTIDGEIYVHWYDCIADYIL